MAFVEDGDEDSNSDVNGDPSTRIYATHSYSNRASPSREQPNTGRSRRGDTSASNSDSAPRSSKKRSDREKEERRRAAAAAAAAEQEEREKQRRRKEKAEAKAHKDSSQALKKVRDRPSNRLKQSHTQPVVQQTSGAYRRGLDEPSYYGISTPASSGNRPRANTRPASYYAGQPVGPPHGSPWAPQSPMVSGGPPHGFPPPGPGPYAGGPPPPQYGGPPPSMYGGPPPPSPTGPHSYFEGRPPMPIQQPSRDLRGRFERPSSAMGFSQSPAGSFEQPYGEYYFAPQHEEPHYNPKRLSRSKQQQQEEDRKRMPPPPKFKQQKEIPRRPSTTAPSSAPFQPPPPRPTSRQQSRPPVRSTNRRSINMAPGHYPTFDEDDSEDDGGLFHDSPEPLYDYRRRPTAGRTRRESKLMYEFDDAEYEPAGRASRRGSLYIPGAGGASLESESKMDSVRRYQEEVSGGPQTPLTAETLRKASKGVASSRSTRSSASRDESDYKQRSNTTGITGITRSSSGGNGENLTMKIAGKAVVRIGDAEIDCEDSEITFSHGQQDMPRGSIGGSDEATTVYQLEEPKRARSTMKALAHRSRDRASSQADSVSRGYGGGHQYAPYEAYDHY